MIIFMSLIFTLFNHYNILRFINMFKFNVRDLEIIRNAKISSSTLKRQLGSMLESSGNCRAIVESLDRETGEYRIILQGTLEPRDNY